MRSRPRTRNRLGTLRIYSDHLIHGLFVTFWTRKNVFVIGSGMVTSKLVVGPWKFIQDPAKRLVVVCT